MKSLLAFVACCRCTEPRSLETKPPASEETQSLVVAVTEPVRRPVLDRKRRTSRSTEWRPSLSSILEDNFLPEIDGRDSSAGSERIVSRKCSSSSVVAAKNVASRSQTWVGGDHRKYDQPMVIPSFAPTFWF